MAGLTDDNQGSVLDEAVQQFIDERLQGREPDIDEFVKQYPDLEHQIREKLLNLQKIDTLFDSLVQADESDFAETVTGHDLVGRKIGNFEIEEMIGRGGMGVVYLARDTKLKRSVAIKSMPVELQAHSTARTRFRREAELLASLNHPNIAVIYEIIEQEEGAGYLVLEYIPGRTLAQRIAHEPLKLEEALSIGQQVAEAVSAAHDKGVIHRDLKPGNIKITPEGKVKVLDFGLAKVSRTEGQSVETAVTQPGRVIGTPTYMSPEQARGKSTDHRTDIWSFGCLMYEMLTGHVPFEGETATDTVARILEREPDWEVLPQEIPMNIRTLLRRCLEKKPQRRLQHIGDAVIEINETLNIPVTAPPVTTPSSTSLKPQITARHKLRIAAIIVVAACVVVLSIIAVQLVSKKEVQPSLKEIRLVVLPFENLGPAADEYFADGITDAITARLAGIHGLSVLSRQSAIQYKDREKNTQQIAEELRVDYILEGTIQRERPTDPNSRVRIIPQLIRACEDAHVWSGVYDDDMSEVFQVQSEIAEQVAQALDITVLEPERSALASTPTENIEAYEYYLRGNEYFSRSTLENDYRIAIRMFERAIELDPTFALAHARLSTAHSNMYGHDYDHSEKRLAMVKETVDRAFQLDPDLPEAHLALGYYYFHGHLDYDRALEQFEIARKSQPNNTELLSMTGFVHKHQGKLEQAVTYLKKSSELNPRGWVPPWQLGQMFGGLRKYSEAERYYDRAISLAPDFPGVYVEKAWVYLSWKGSTEKARAVVEEGIKSTGKPFGDTLAALDLFDGNYQEALDWHASKSEDFGNMYDFVGKALQCAKIYRYMGDNEKAKEHFEQTIDILKSKITEDPNDAWCHSCLGIAYAGLGDKEDAIREGKVAVELFPVSKDAVRGPYRVADLAKIYVMVGEFDEAIDQIEYLLSIPWGLSIPLLRLDPVWGPLRDHPRFKKLVEAGK